MPVKSEALSVCQRRQNEQAALLPNGQRPPAQRFNKRIQKRVHEDFLSKTI